MSGQGEPGPQGTPEGTAPTASEQTVSMLSDAAQDTGPGTTDAKPEGGAPESQPETQQTTQTIGSDFLKSVPEEQRAALESFVKQWDAGVTRRFQELQSQYAPYRQLLDMGVDPTDVQNALQIYTLLDTNPNYLYQLLKTELENPDGAEDQGQQGLQDDEEYNLPPQVQQQLEQLTAVVEALAQRSIQSTEQQQEASEDAELSQYLDLLKTEKGNFDETFVLARMASGMSGADAVDAWNSMLQERLNAAGQGNGAPPVPGSNLPPILSGGGVPVHTENIGSAKDKDVQGLVAKMLEQAAANNS